MNIAIGIDVGNDGIKVKTDSSQVNIMSILSRGYDRRFLSDQDEPRDPVNQIDVEVCSNDKDYGRFFVGGLAFSANRNDILERVKGEKKAESTHTFVLALVSAAYSLLNIKNPVSKKERVSLGIGLPTEEYFDENLREAFKKKFLGTHIVKFNGKCFNNAEITMVVSDVIIIPEGTAAAMYIFFDEDGKLKPEFKKYKNILLTIDIGSLTTDVSGIQNGSFHSQVLFGINYGMADALNKMRSTIKRKIGVDVKKHQLDYFLKTNTFPYDDTISLEDLKEEAYEDLASLLAVNIYDQFDINGVQKEDIGLVYVTGGGALALEKYLKTQLGVKEVKETSNPLFDNAAGYHKVIKNKVMSEIKSQQEVFEDDVASSKE